MGKNAIPSDVQRDIQKKRRRRVWPSALWYGLWAVSLVLYYERNPDARPNWILPIFVAALLLLPLWMFRLREVLFDRAFEGKIVRIKYRMMSEIPFLSEDVGRVERHETAILFVKNAKGRRRRFACRRLWHAADRCYKVGDTVRHIPLVALPQNLSCPPEEGNLCLVCGVLSTDSHEHCAACGHTIF